MAVTIKSVVAPSNMGKTLVLGAIEADKYDVKLETTQFTVAEDGTVKLHDDVVADLSKYIASGAVNGSNLELTREDGSKVTIDVSTLVPMVKADRFLKEVTYNAADKKLVFTVASFDGTEESDTPTVLEVAVGDLLPVVAGDGLEGDGTTANPLKIKTSTDNANPIVVDENGVTLDQTKLKAFAKETRDVELQDVAGNVLGYAYSVA